MSNNSNREKITNIVGKGVLVNQVMKYINNILKYQPIFNEEDIKKIVTPILKSIILNKKYKQLLFLLNENIPLGKNYSFFDPSITQNKIVKNKVVMPKGMSRSWNIFNDDKFKLLKEKLEFIKKHSEMLNDILEESKFEQYKETFEFDSDYSNLKDLINELINAENIVEREMNIYNFMVEYGKKGKYSTTL